MFSDNFLYRLTCEYAKIQKEVMTSTGKTLYMPTISIVPMNNKWGDWTPSKELIRLNEKLFQIYGWDAVIYVFRHEVAHQIVNKIFDFNAEGCPHGEHFDIACSILNIPSSTCASADFLMNFKCVQEENPIVDKIRKLYIKGHDKAATEDEQVLFMNKACQLMDKYNIKLNNITGSDNLYLRRQVTEGIILEVLYQSFIMCKQFKLIIVNLMELIGNINLAWKCLVIQQISKWLNMYFMPY